MSEASPKRRWLQFSLATMFFVVTAFAIWLAWELSYIRERKAFLESVKQELEIQDRAALVAVAPGGWIISSNWTVRPPATIPFWRKWFGDEAVDDVRMPKKASAIDLEKAKALFPESQITQ
jgi:hypothetical protein